MILENYLNTINLGAGSYGVQAASKKYFNKDVWDLNLSECATLAGITQNPTKFNPITNPKQTPRDGRKSWITCWIRITSHRMNIMQH